MISFTMGGSGITIKSSMTRLPWHDAACRLLLGAVCLPALGAPAAAPAPSPPAYTCEIEARFDRLDDAHYIPVRGKTSLPDRAVLRVGAFYLKPPSERFLRPDRPPPLPDLYLLDETEIVLQGGRFEARLWIVSRIPYPGTYRVRVQLRWVDQPAALRGESPEDREPLEWSVDLVNGTVQDLEQERESIRKEIKADVDRLVAIQKEAAARFRRALRDAAAVAALETYAGTVLQQLASVKAGNEKRLEQGVIWTETQGKYRIQDLSERVEALMGVYREAVRARAADPPREAVEQEQAFRAIHEGALNLLGFVKPVDPALVREHLGPILEDLPRLERAAEALKADSPGMTTTQVEAMRDAVFGRLRAGLGALLPEGPEQAVDPATAYTEAVTAFFTDALAVAGGDRSMGASLTKALGKAKDSLHALRGLMASE
jgi:hypothetical protein